MGGLMGGEGGQGGQWRPNPLALSVFTAPMSAGRATPSVTSPFSSAPNQKFRRTGKPFAVLPQPKAWTRALGLGSRKPVETTMATEGPSLERGPLEAQFSRGGLVMTLSTARWALALLTLLCGPAREGTHSTEDRPMKNVILNPEVQEGPIQL